MTLIEAKAVFVDTNILVYSTLPASPFYQPALERLQNLRDQEFELWISRQVIREFLVTMTKPANLTAGLTVNQVVAGVSRMLNSFQIADETAEVTTYLTNLLTQLDVRGSQIYDANIVATMQANNIKQLLTHNVSDFTRYNNFIRVLPLVEP